MNNVYVRLLAAVEEVVLLTARRDFIITVFSSITMANTPEVLNQILQVIITVVVVCLSFPVGQRLYLRLLW